jgi:hypothetical protein
MARIAIFFCSWPFRAGRCCKIAGWHRLPFKAAPRQQRGRRGRRPSGRTRRAAASTTNTASPDGIRAAWRDLYLIGDEIDYDISDAWNGHGRIMQCDRGAPDCAARWHAYCGGTKTIVSVLEIRHATVRPLCDCTVSEAWCLHEQVESLWGTLQRSRGIQAW